MFDFLFERTAFESVVLTFIGTILLAAAGVFFRRLLALLGRLREYRMLVYVSLAGSCRDPMAKVITEQLLKDRKPRARIHGSGILLVGNNRASKPAQFVVKEAYGKDLLKNYKPQQISEDLANKAKLILVMEESNLDILRKRFPQHVGKLHALKPFFGQTGDVSNPYRAPDEMSEEALNRYRATFSELEGLISKNLDKLYEVITQ